MIHSNVALQLMEKKTKKGNRVPFQISFVTADRDQWRRRLRLLEELKRFKEGTAEYESINKTINSLDIGGKIIKADKCVLSGNRGVHVKAKKQPSKTPNHWNNKTRNILFESSGAIRKVHIRLITEINNQKVIY